MYFWSKLHYMDVSPVILAIPVFFILIGVEVGYGYYQNRKLYRLNDAVANISCGIVEQLTGVFAKVFTVAAYHFVYTKFAVFSLADTWYWILLCFIGVDFCYYWAHRMSHEVNLFWLGHIVHHQSEDYNLSVALRQSVFQKMFTFYFYFPLAILGFKTEWFLLVGAFNLLYQFWIHTEVIDKMPRWFEYVFNTPSHHRVHHGRDPKYIDRNHAGSLMFWDRMFGTFQPEEERPTYGITTPVNSWNPIKANLQPFVALWQEMKQVPGIGNKIRLAFMPPGWYPAELGGFRRPKPVDRETYQKFDIDISPALNFYLFAQYLLVLVGTALFLFNLATFHYSIQLLLAALVVLSVMGLGLMFENKQQAVTMELIRFFLTIALTLYLFFEGLTGWWMPLGMAIWAFGSLGILMRIGFHRVARAK